MAMATNFSDEELAAFCLCHPKRLVGFTSINPDRYQPERKVERAVKEFGMKAVKLYPHSGFYPNDPRLARTYDLCSRLGIPVVWYIAPKVWAWKRRRAAVLGRHCAAIATIFPFEKSYFARLKYVNNNAVHHGLVPVANQYPFCSAGWFEQKADPMFQKKVDSFRCDKLNVIDDF